MGETKQLAFLVIAGLIAGLPGLCLVTIVSPLFGHSPDDRFKEKLECDAFARFLSDMAMVQKYAPADSSMRETGSSSVWHRRLEIRLNVP